MGRIFRRDGVFQSTPPARGATPEPEPDPAPAEHFNPRPPRGGRRARLAPCTARVAPFQSTPPARGATHGYKPSCVIFDISIHAPREGGDRGPAEGQPDRRDFNPRPPRGGRRDANSVGAAANEFQSTPPARGATPYMQSGQFAKNISIHAPREGGDARRVLEEPPSIYFNPRPPRGGRRKRIEQEAYNSIISIHAPREGGDVLAYLFNLPIMISIHAPREGGDLVFEVY